MLGRQTRLAAAVAALLPISAMGCGAGRPQAPVTNGPRPSEMGKPTRVGVVTSLTGSAALERQPAPPRALNTRGEIALGDRITTGDKSEIKIILAGRAELRMFATASVTVTGGRDRFVLTIEKGMVIYTMADTQEVQQIVTPNTSLRVVGAITWITVTTGSRLRETSVCAQRGSVSAAVVGGGSVTVEDDQCVAIVEDRIGPVHPFFPTPPPRGIDTGSIVLPRRPHALSRLARDEQVEPWALRRRIVFFLRTA